LKVLTIFVTVMTTAQNIAQQIECIPEDSTFGYVDLNITKEKFLTAAKAIERLLKAGKIKKISKGKFYKPKMTVFGELKPSETELLKPYLFQNGKRIAYVTGNYLYNKLGLTRQITTKLNIASRSKRIFINAGTLKASAVKSYAEVTEDNYQLLGFLDAIKDFKIIPDLNTKVAIEILSNTIENLSKQKLKMLVKYALLYPARVRALLGAIIENNNNTNQSDRNGIKPLIESLNPLSKYKLLISKKDLPTIANWNIV